MSKTLTYSKAKAQNLQSKNNHHADGQPRRLSTQPDVPQSSGESKKLSSGDIAVLREKLAKLQMPRQTSTSSLLGGGGRAGVNNSTGLGV